MANSEGVRSWSGRLGLPTLPPFWICLPLFFLDPAPGGGGGGGGGAPAAAVTGLHLLEGPGVGAKMVGRFTLCLARWSDH